MAIFRFLRSAPFCGTAAMLGILLSPSAALAEEEDPGYGGTADAVAVAWVPGTDQTEWLTLDAVGFGSDSPVVVRVGAAPDRTVRADETGALRVLVVSVADAARARPTAGTTVLPVDAGTAGSLATGMSVAAIGRDPAGGIRTVVGTVPPRVTGNGVQDVVPWVALAGVALASGLLTRPIRLGRLWGGAGGQAPAADQGSKR